MGAWEHGQAPDPSAVWVDRGPWVDGAASHLHVRHPGCAWHAQVPEQALLEAAAPELPGAAMGYLQALAPFAPELREAIDRLRSPKGLFGWLPLKWGLHETPPADRDACASFVVARRPREAEGPPGPLLDGNLVLLAGHRMPGHGLALGDGVGLRLTASIGEAVDGRRTLRFTSLNAARLGELLDRLPDWIVALCTVEASSALREQMADVLALKQPAVHAIRKGSRPARWIIQGSGTRLRPDLPKDGPDHAKKRAPAFEFEVEVEEPGRIVAVARLEEPGARMADDTSLRLFERDPASQVGAVDLPAVRPGSVASVLDELRDFVAGTAGTSRYARALQSDDGLFFVSHERTSPAYEKDNPDSPTGRKIARLPARPAGTSWRAWLPLRSDDLAASQAYFRARELFDRLRAYGFAVTAYFRHAELPLELRARARLPGAHDGHTLNANVRPYFGGLAEATGPVAAAPQDLINGAGEAHPRLRRAHLMVRFGSADAAVTSGKQTLGLAADPRWAWHEFGHVLNYAATGELELPFAHSAGDALAAIAADPDSRLAADEKSRGMTFPWAYVPRRHDRQARQGHCWCGERIAMLRSGPPAWAGYRHAYFEEQLLSSSLFRLYLAIGGGTGVQAGGTAGPAAPSPADLPDLQTRRSASDYCVYLIVRATALLGPNGVAPAIAPDQFVGALVDADLGTGAWSIAAPWPYREAALRSVERQGGRVHKVIRWAFEQQGLYAAAGSPAGREGPGLPPPVDFFIADGRTPPGGDTCDGGYWPVPLRWPAGDPAAWLASPEAFDHGTRGEIGVRVQQRGQLRRPPAEAQVSLWAGRVSGKGVRWQRCRETGPGRFSTDDIRWPGGGWWLASVDHPADRSNLGDEAPPADFAALVELVANDNNIALAPMG